MMAKIKKVKVELKEKGYEIFIGSGLIKETGKLISKVIPSKRAFLVSNPKVLELHAQPLLSALQGEGFEVKTLMIEDGEQAKSLESAARLYDELIEAGANRSDLIIAFGGGVIGDLAGFVASTFMRGLPLVQIPTTLLSQVDSSVGGKTAVNLPKAKNMVGTFYQPKLVLIDIDLLKTLEERDLKAGLAEVIKSALLCGGDFLAFLQDQMDSILLLKEEALARAIELACSFKAKVVEEDEEDLGRRAILNYGHTVGHALEAICGYSKYRHGEAVAVGMTAAGRIAQRLGLLDEEELGAQEDLILRAGLDTELPTGLSKDLLIERILLDKKGKGDEVNFILLEGPGRPIIRPIKIKEAIDLLSLN